MSHEGHNTHRLSQNPLEKALHDAWIEANMHGHILEYILGNGETRATVNDRDEMVAATIVQWIGTPVGKAFLQKVGML